VRHTPQASTAISTCPGPGSGSGSSAARSGVRAASRTIARTGRAYPPRGAVLPARHDSHVQLATVATHTARSIRRRLAAAARERSRRGHAGPPRAQPAPPAERHPEGRADDARLDALRGELVRELDRLATEDGSGASFRRL